MISVRQRIREALAAAIDEELKLALGTEWNASMNQTLAGTRA